MVEERVYKLDDNTNMILIEHAIYNNKRYLLLNKENTDEIVIAYEENNELNIIDESYENYKEIAQTLYSKMKNN